MSPPTNRRRIALLAVVVLTSGAAAVGAYEYRQFRSDRRAVDAGEAGREAFARADYGAALDGLGVYLQRFQGRTATADDYVMYARARRRVEAPNGRHVAQAIAALRKAREIDPTSADANRDLLELYVAAGYATEALELLDALTARTPDDLALLRTKRDVLARLRQFPKALDAARDFNRVAPDDLPGFLATLSVLAASEAPAGMTDAWVAGAIAAHAADPRFELLRAAVLVARGDSVAAAPIFDRLLARTTDARDPTFVALFVAQLDAAGRFADSLRVLERLAADGDEPRQRELVRRLWYAGRLKDVVARLESGVADPDPELVALHALALTALGRRSDAEPLRQDLSARRDSAGQAWSAFTSYECGGPSDAPRETVESLRAAVGAVPDSAFMRHALGDAAAALDEREMAIDAWNAAAERAPSWARPLREIARVLLATPGGESAAVVAARAALSRAPNDAETVATYLRAAAAGVGEMTAAQRDELLVVVKSIQAQAPEQSAELLPLEVRLAARTDKAAAERRLRDVLASDTPPAEATLVQLAQVAVDAGIPLEADLLDLSASVHGVTAQLATAKAVARARAAGPAAGLAAFDESRAAARAGGSTSGWDVARATYVDRNRLPDACVAWVALGDAHPDDLQVQLRMLASDAAWSDRAAIARCIERTRALTGEQATTWRIARARWLLSGDSSDAADAAEAASLLGVASQRARLNLSAHMLLARALERLGNLPGAEDQYRLAGGLGVGRPRISLELSRLALMQGRSDEARTLVDRALASRDIAPDLSQTAARFLAVQGDLVRSREIVEPLATTGRADRDGLLLLARLDANLGEFDKAIALCERLLKFPDAEAAELAADIDESIGRSVDARAALSRLDAMNLRPGERELVRARHAATWGSTEETVEAFRRAVAAAPQNAGAWTQFVEFVVSKGDAASLEHLLADPDAADVEQVRFLIGLASLRQDATADARLRPLLVVAAQDVGARTVLTQAMLAIAQSRDDPARRAEVARTLRELADANLRVLPLQVLAADLSAAAGDLGRATETARRTMSQFPDSPEGARQTATMLAAVGKWDEALQAGLAWRVRAGGRGRVADVFVAQVMLRLGRAADAVAVLAPRIQVALTHPAAGESLLLTYCVALCGCGRSTTAKDLLADLSRKSDRWRLLPLMLEPSQWTTSAAGADAWLAVCTGNVSVDDPKTQLPLARAWSAAWSRFRAAEMLAAAREIFARLTSKPDSTAEVWHEAGLLEHAAGDVVAARRLYLGALSKDSGHAVTHNDLAMLLADAGQWREAVVHATKATDLLPGDANCRDTLAHAWRVGGQFENAAAALVEACRLDPANAKWRLELAEVYAESGKTQDAEREAARVEEMASLGAELPAAQLERLRLLRSRPR